MKPPNNPSTRIRMAELEHLERLITSEDNRVKGMGGNVYYVSFPQDFSRKRNNIISFLGIDFSIVLSRYLCLHGLHKSNVVIAASSTADKFRIIKGIKNITSYRDKKRYVEVLTMSELQIEKDVVILYLGKQEIRDPNFSSEFFALLTKIRRAFYIIGAEDCLAGLEDTQAVLNMLKTGGIFGPSMWISCEQHRLLKQIFPFDGSSFPLSGGCDQVCSAVQNCYHLCTKLCHPLRPSRHGGRGRDSDGCQDVCGRKCTEKTHYCKLPCHFPKDCPPCSATVAKKLNCGRHSLNLTCHELWKNFRTKCTQCDDEKLNEKTHQSRSSDDASKTSNAPDTISDPGAPEPELIMCRLGCGHINWVIGSKGDTVEECRFKVAVPRCHHLVPEKVPCAQRCDPLPKRDCKFECAEKLTCGARHLCYEKCEGVSLSPEEHKKRHPCSIICSRMCKNRHPCYPKHLCSTPCPPCNVLFIKNVPKQYIRPDKVVEFDQVQELQNPHYICHEEEAFIQSFRETYADYFVNPPEICKKLCSQKRHPCSALHSSRDKCPKCSESVKYGFRNCGHSLTLPCEDNRNLARQCSFPCSNQFRRCDHTCFALCGQHKFGVCPPCKTLVTTLKPCGHEWTHECGQSLPENDRCLEDVDGTNLATCGHAGIFFPCYLTQGMAVGGADMYCKAQCGFFFDPQNGGCGHNCTGICSECTFTLFHSECSHITTRTNVCGHVVQEPCYIGAACRQKCETSCQHRRCNLPCAFPCPPCKEPCGYECAHGKCTNLCGEPCNKRPCEEKCPKLLLKCNHQCAGFCGEPCPPLCTMCDRDSLILNNYLGKFEIEQDDRFIFLVNCGHTFESESLDLLMSVDIVDGQISVKRCPLCRQVIRHNKRYSSILGKIERDIESVKNIIYGSVEEIHMKLFETLKLVSKTSAENGPEMLETLRLSILSEIRQYQKQHFISGNQDNTPIYIMDFEKASFLHFIAHFYTKSLQLWTQMQGTLSEELREDWESFIGIVVDVLGVGHYPSKLMTTTRLAQEWDRIVAASKLFIKQSDCQPDVVKRLLELPRAKRLFNKAMCILTNSPLFDETAREKFDDLCSELDDALENKLRISEEERMNILEAFNHSVGRWFKCPQGHVYVVTECGGATEEGNCNECGARVGGTSHRALPSNELATEMDGATQPLYPTVFESDY